MREVSFEQVLAEDDKLLFKSNGTSMLPLIRPGRDYVNIIERPAGPLKKYDIVLFRRETASGIGAYILHRIIKVNADGSYWIVGDNCVSGETVADGSIVGVLGCISRRGKIIKLKGPAYRLYVIVWCAAYPLRFLILKVLRKARRLAGRIIRRLTPFRTVQ